MLCRNYVKSGREGDITKFATLLYPCNKALIRLPFCLVSGFEKNGQSQVRGLSLFMRKLKSCFTREQVEQLGGSTAIDRRFRIGTAHSFKGLEFDIVFSVRACQGAFPLVHPDYVLFRLFGDSEQQILDDERRLFYVAVARAKEQVWFLTETDCESDFVSALMKIMGPNKGIHRAESSRAAREPRR